MWNWVKNAVSWAGNAVKKVVNTVKNANQIIDKVSNASVSTIVDTASNVNRVSNVNKVSEVKNVSTGSSSSWKDKYNKVPTDFSRTIKE